MTKPQYPMQFSTTAQDSNPDEDTWEANRFCDDQHIILKAGIPVEFGGSGAGYSPEDLMAMALANCFVATARVYAKASRIQLSEMVVKASYTIDVPEGERLPKITAAHFDVKLLADNVSRAERLMTKLQSSCIMLNALACEKTFDVSVGQL